MAPNPKNRLISHRAHKIAWVHRFSSKNLNWECDIHSNLESCGIPKWPILYWAFCMAHTLSAQNCRSQIFWVETCGLNFLNFTFLALRKWKQFIENGTAENFDIAIITKFCTTKNVLWLESGKEIKSFIERTLYSFSTKDCQIFQI